MTPDHVVKVGSEQFRVPIRSVGGIEIAYLDFLCDRRLVQACARELATLLPEQQGAIVVPATGAIPLGFALAEVTDRPLVVLRKGSRGYMGDVLTIPVRSIASPVEEALLVEVAYLPVLRRLPVTLLDTVTTTGSTIRAMEALMEVAEVSVADRAVCFVEGDDADATVTHLGRLPVFPESLSGAPRGSGRRHL